MAAFRLLLVCCVLLVFPLFSDSLPEPGKMQMKFSKDLEYRAFPKALYKGANISVKGKCTSDKLEQITIKWKLKYTQCADFFLSLKDLDPFWGELRKYELHGEDTVKCNTHIHLTDRSSQKEYIPPNENATVAVTSKSTKDINSADEKTEPPERKDPKKEEKSPKRTGGTPAESVDDNDDGNDDKEVEQKTSHTNRKGDGKGIGSTGNKIPPEDDSTESQKAKKKNRERRATNQDEESKSLLRVKREGDHQEETADRLPVTKKAVLKNNQQTSKQAKTGKPDTTAIDTPADGPKAKPQESKPAKENKVPKNPMDNKGSSRIASTKRDGIYLLIVKVVTESDETFKLELDVSMESKSGYLSATDWPLLPFYGIMSLVYLFYGIVWLIVSACQWRDLLRIQFWIGGVIALGMLEKAVFYSEYNNINNTGIQTPSLVVFAEIVSIAKRTLARMLVIIVSMGFGIVKPRLGKSLHRVLGVGALYFIIGVIEGCLRSLSLKADPSKGQLIAGIPLAVLDAAICWWIFMSLVQTTRTLRIRRNVIKLSLYRHFTNTLIFAVLASVAYMIWSIKTHKFADCIKDWSELWLDEAFWPFLFSIILLVIMILWRPTANNQRYAFTPIVDFDDEEEDNITLSEAFDGMKMRNTRTEVIVNGDSKRKAEDDLKWVEENIPSSAADTVLPSVLDSDEELMTTKFEMSKME